MNTEKTNAAAAISDEELENVTGGVDHVAIESTGKYYRWEGGKTNDNSKFLCPRCKRPVHTGSLRRYYCDPCDCSWYYEEKLVPNVNGGPWKEISEAEYLKDTKCPFPLFS